jgi:hypothetical protein
MRPSPSIVPGIDRDTYLVLDDFGGSLGLAWRETGIEDTDLGTVIRDLLDGQYSSPVRIIAFNTAERWSRDVSEDIARELTDLAPKSTGTCPSACGDSWSVMRAQRRKLRVPTRHEKTSS